MKFWKSLLLKLGLLVSVFGPATITAIADNDAAGVATYSLAGAKFGYSILFVLFLVTLLLAITQEMGVRIAIVTGKGLADLIRERYGVKMAVLVFSVLVIANMGTIIANMSALKASAQMFGLSPFIVITVMIFLAFIFVSKGNYNINQNIFLIGAFMYFAYVVSAIKAQPNWGEALRNLVVPTNMKLSTDYLLAAIAVLGTTITPWGQFFIQSFMNDKKVSIERIKYAQFETYFGALVTDFFSFFMIVATAATLFAHKIPLISGEQAALAIKPFAGDLASLLFGLGLMNAGFMGIVIISLTTAYAFAEFFGFEGSLDVPFQKGKLFYGLFLFQLIVAALFVSIPGVSLFKIVFYTQSLNGILLPIIFYFQNYE
jgi:NRAMP (natural resistance-associated macrophage protein)-like metal ion transporter